MARTRKVERDPSEDARPGDGPVGLVKPIPAVPMPTAPGPEPSAASAAPPAAEAEVKYSFPSLGRCPICGTINNQSDGVHGNVQYRRCYHPWCRMRNGGKDYRWKVIGTPI